MDGKKYGPILLRYGLSAVFLWFGLNQILFPSEWLAWLPGWVHSLPISATMFVITNGIIEVLLGILLIAGLFTRLVALALGFHLLGIAFTVGYNDIGVRDFGLSLAVLSVSLRGPDAWCLDQKIKTEKPFWRFVLGL